MNRDEFEQAYADKYTAGDYIVARDNRDGEGYTDHHIDLCWKVQIWNNTIERNHYLSLIPTIEW